MPEATAGVGPWLKGRVEWEVSQTPFHAALGVAGSAVLTALFRLLANPAELVDCVRSAVGAGMGL